MIDAAAPPVGMGDVLRRASDQFRTSPATFLAFAAPLAAASALGHLGPWLAPGWEGYSLAQQALYSALVPWCWGGMFVAMDARVRGRDMAWGSALIHAGGRYWPQLGTYLLSALATVVGMLFLVVPGLLAMAAFAVAMPACALEDRGPLDAMGRSGVLTRGNRWRSLGLSLLLLAFLLATYSLVLLAGMAFGADPEYSVASNVVAAVVTEFAMFAAGGSVLLALYHELLRVNGQQDYGEVFA